MAAIGRFSGRAPWLSMAAFGITGCLTALPHGSAAAAKNSSAGNQQMEANYYTSAAGQGASASKDISSARRSGTSASPAVARSSTRKSTASRSSSGRASSGKSGHSFSSQNEPSQTYVQSSTVNYYTAEEQAGSQASGPARYEAGAVTEAHSHHAHGQHASHAHVHTHTHTHSHGSGGLSGDSAEARIINTSAMGTQAGGQQASGETRRGIFGRAFQRSTAAVTTVKNASASAVKSISASAARGKEVVIRPSRHTGFTQSGVASWYGGKFHGGKTASGERYDQNSMTAAHLTLPFGTLVKVKNLVNGRECVVRINNRGPFTKGRILDMSKAAAAELGFMGRGIARVQMQVLGMAEK